MADDRDRSPAAFLGKKKNSDHQGAINSGYTAERAWQYYSYYYCDQYERTGENAQAIREKMLG